MNWINAAENTLIAFEKKNQIPFRLKGLIVSFPNFLILS